VRCEYRISRRSSSTLALPDRLTGIDESNRDEHYFLAPDDHCYFFGEFFSNKGYSGGPTNQLITNYKRTPSEIAASPKASALRYYRDRAIAEIAAGMRRQFRSLVERCTFVPLPSSKIFGDLDYCDRLEQTLRRAFGDFPHVDIRILLRQTESIPADHKRLREGCRRIRYEDLLAITEIDDTQLAQPLRDAVILFDDVITSGKHYKVAKTRVLEISPGREILGIFVARAIHANPLEDLIL
jgi:hypothetical protein